MKKSVVFATILIAFISMLAVGANAAQAEDITLSSAFTSDKQINASLITDGNNNTYVTVTSDTLRVTSEVGISSVYLVFEEPAAEFRIEDIDSGVTATFGGRSFMHEFVDLESAFGYAPDKIAVHFDSNKRLGEINLFSVGTVPDRVQIWEEPLDECDLLLFASHSDDDQLFFAGLLPYYAGELEYDVQIAYIVNHLDVPQRCHELLAGLWHCGIKSYPIISAFPDLYNMSYDEAVAVYAKHGITFGDFVSYITDTVERTKPLCIVSHDLAGEYGHGTHILCSAAIIEALSTITEDGIYGVGSDGRWKTAKVYFHLYGDRQTELELDAPLEKFGGKTAFGVSQDAFAYHKSQHWTWFKGWLYGTSDAPITLSTQIRSYSPRYYGLYYSAVGSDVNCSDLFENLDTRAQVQEKREAEESRRAEESRLAEESRRAEESRLEQESLTAEESRSAEESRRAAESEAERAKQAEQKKQDIMLLCVTMAAIILSVAISAAILIGRTERKLNRH